MQYKIEDLKQDCYYHAVICGYSDVFDFCKKKMKKCELLQYIEKCGNEKNDCYLCKLQFKRKEINNHKKNVPNRMIECAKCQEKYMLKNGHEEIICMNNQKKI